MDRNSVIIVTGAAGFIGSCMTGYLNRKGYNNIIIVDDFTDDEKRPNYIDKKIVARVERQVLFDWLQQNPVHVDIVIHLGARTDTTEFDYAVHERLNLVYSKEIWQYCAETQIPLIYASSAATYGAGEFGYKDDHEIVAQLQPLNPYGISKNEFDKWVLSQKNQPPFWAGLKFFNVYGPNEFHKARMASVVLHAYNQIRNSGTVKLFRSHNPEFRDGEQLRDFVYADDVVKIMYWMMNHWEDEKRLISALYNVGTGEARTFNDLALAIFSSLQLPVNIEYIDTPIDIREKYQYFTEADMSKLRAAGYPDPFFTLEKGIDTYINNFLLGHKIY